MITIEVSKGFATNQELGKTPEDIFNYLTQPKNMSILKEIDGEVKREVKIL